mmetsp:Transcript_12082/g.29716  ORF Transcript_12082/g.29716 Transcript_12082/m.29716 type:complete len:195 (-) Transcript_12082:15-599(-)
MDATESKIDTYTIVMEATSKNGIPSLLLDASIATLEEMMNSILFSVTDFQVTLRNQKDGVDIFLCGKGNELTTRNQEIAKADQNAYHTESQQSILCSIANGSGYERFISGLVIQIALSWFSQKSKPDFIAIDEGFGCLDANNLGKIGVLFDYLRQQYQFLIIITHVDQIKDDVDNEIEILVNRGESQINYGFII